MEADRGEAFSQLATVTIQGGGVFGLSLLGQLRAVEETGFEVAAFAGSSAGALIACLAWAGYGANETLEEIFKLLRDKGLSKALQNAGDEWSAQEALLAKIGSYYNKIGSSNAIVDGARILRLVSLIKSSHAFQRQGLVDGLGIERWIDTLLCQRLNRLRLAHGLDPIAEPATFAQFFDTYEAIDRHRQPLLLMGVTNLSREDFLIIDSHSSAFQHLSVASVVRASISFPAFFRPKELTVIRDRKTGRIADSRSFQQGTTYESEELFVDGGVVSNFPAWTIFDLARETMWGGSSDSKQLRASPACTPLRASAYRPMVHIGLQVRKLAPLSDVEQDSPQEGPEIGREIAEEEFLVRSSEEMQSPMGYWRALFELATGGGQAWLEGLLIGHGSSARGARTTFLGQNINTSGWQHHTMELNKLTVAKAGEMFNTGRNFAKARLEGLQFDFRQQNLVAQRFEVAANLLARQIAGLTGEESEKIAPPEGWLHFIKGPLGEEALVPVFRYPAGKTEIDRGEALPLSRPADDAPQLKSLKSRSLVIMRKCPGADPGSERIILCAPILDSREVASHDLSGLDLESEDALDDDAVDDDLGDDGLGDDESDEDAFRDTHVSENRFYGVIFGILTMEWKVPLGTARRLWENAEEPADLVARIDDIINGLVSPIGQALSSDFGRPSRPRRQSH